MADRAAINVILICHKLGSRCFLFKALRLMFCIRHIWGHAVAQLMHCITSQKVAGSIPDDVIAIFH
jgi:hypothetical protein